MHRGATLLALFLLAACGRPDAPERPAAPAPASAAVVMPPPPAGPRWEVSVTGTGVALTLADASEGVNATPILRLACARRPAELLAFAGKVEQIGSEDRFTVGLDDEPFIFVADIGESRLATGVEARAPWGEQFLARLETARTVGAAYGRHAVGPFSAPPREMKEKFVRGCRNVAAAPGP